LVELRRDQARDAADDATPAYVLRDALLVDAVLQRDDEAVGREIFLDHHRRPFRVVRFHREKHDVDGLLLHQVLHFAEVHGADRDGVFFLRGNARELEAVLAHVLDVLGPGIDERDVVARARQVPPDVAAQCARSYEYDSLAHLCSPVDWRNYDDRAATRSPHYRLAAVIHAFRFFIMASA